MHMNRIKVNSWAPVCPDYTIKVQRKDCKPCPVEVEQCYNSLNKSELITDNVIHCIPIICNECVYVLHNSAKEKIKCDTWYFNYGPCFDACLEEYMYWPEYSSCFMFDKKGPIAEANKICGKAHPLVPEGNLFWHVVNVTRANTWLGLFHERFGDNVVVYDTFNNTFITCRIINPPHIFTCTPDDINYRAGVPYGKQCIIQDESHECDGIYYIACQHKKCKLPVKHKCTHNAECLSSLCLNGTCSCKTDEWLGDGNVCHKGLQLDAACQNNISCSTINLLSYCHSSRKICVCSTNAFRSVTQCHQRKALGANCKSNIECITQSCIDEKCDCPQNQYRMDDNCEKKKSIFEKCAVHGECTTQNCKNGKCDCRPETTNINGACIYGAYVSTDKCLSNQDCVKGAICDAEQSRCKCEDGLYSKNANCHQKLNINAPCNMDYECQSGYCNSRICTCPITKYVSGIFCLSGKNLNDICTKDHECSTTIKDSFCEDKAFCRCKPGFRHFQLDCIPDEANYNCYISMGLILQELSRSYKDPNNYRIHTTQIKEKIREIMSNEYNGWFITISNEKIEDNGTFVQWGLYFSVNGYFDPENDISETLITNFGLVLIGLNIFITITPSTLAIKALECGAMNVQKSMKLKISLIVIFLILLLATVLSLVIYLMWHKNNKYKVYAKWKQKKMRNPYIPNGDALKSLAKQLELLDDDLQYFNMEQLKIKYLEYFYNHYYDFDYEYTYDLSYKYALAKLSKEQDVLYYTNSGFYEENEYSITSPTSYEAYTKNYEYE